MRHKADREIEALLKHILLLLERVVEYLLEKDYAVTAQLGVDPMATTATLTFVDENGNPAAPPKGDGSGITVTFSSDNPNVTVGTATGNGDTATAEITGHEAFNLSATVANTSGTSLVDDDGTTPFVQPTEVAVPASEPPVPQATTATLSVS